eukprot:scaffold285888_cov112-Attheya_sp.AAC.1
MAAAATDDEVVNEAPPSKQEEEEEDEEDLEKLQAEIARMEEEAARIAKETEELRAKSKSAQGGSAASASASTGTSAATSSSDKAADGVKRDGLSVYVGQVDYTSTPEELLAHFEACGTVERVTIVCDKFSGRPKGTSQIESSQSSFVRG